MQRRAGIGEEKPRIFAPEENVSDLGLRDSDELLWKGTMNILNTLQKPNGFNPFTHSVGNIFKLNLSYKCWQWEKSENPLGHLNHPLTLHHIVPYVRYTGFAHKRKKISKSPM